MTPLQVYWLDINGQPTADCVRGAPCIKIRFGANRPGLLVEPIYALIDTGADYDGVDARLIEKYSCPKVRSVPIFGQSGIRDIGVYRAIISIPEANLFFDQDVMEMPVPDRPVQFQAILGRSFLQHARLVYDGHAGSAELQFEPNPLVPRT